MTHKQQSCDLCGGALDAKHRCVECRKKKKYAKISATLRTVFLSLLTILLTCTVLTGATLQSLFKGNALRDAISETDIASIDVTSFVETEKQSYPLSQYILDTYVEDSNILLSDVESMIRELELPALITGHLDALDDFCSGRSDTVPQLSSETIVQLIEEQETNIYETLSVRISRQDKTLLAEKLAPLDSYQETLSELKESSLKTALLRFCYSKWLLIGCGILLILLLAEVIRVFYRARWKRGKAVLCHTLCMLIPSGLLLIGDLIARIAVMAQQLPLILQDCAGIVCTTVLHCTLLVVVPAVCLLIIALVSIKLAKPYPTPASVPIPAAPEMPAVSPQLAEESAVAPAVQEPNSLPENEAVSISAEDEKTVISCPNCGREAPQGTKFCTKCGTDLQSQKEEQMQA